MRQENGEGGPRGSMIRPSGSTTGVSKIHSNNPTKDNLQQSNMVPLGGYVSELLCLCPCACLFLHGPVSLLALPFAAVHNFSSSLWSCNHGLDFLLVGPVTIWLSKSM